MKFFVILVRASSALALSACDALLQPIGERKYEAYSDMAAAKAARATERGWLPEWLPNEIRDIHLYYDLDTNERAISFKLPSTGTFEGFSGCRAEDTPTSPQLQTQLFPSSPHKLHGVIDCEDLYAVQDKSGIIHMWTKPGKI